jgi:hypothetical protein
MIGIGPLDAFIIAVAAVALATPALVYALTERAPADPMPRPVILGRRRATQCKPSQAGTSRGSSEEFQSQPAASPRTYRLARTSPSVPRPR